MMRPVPKREVHEMWFAVKASVLIDPVTLIIINYESDQKLSSTTM